MTETGDDGHPNRGKTRLQHRKKERQAGKTDRDRTTRGSVVGELNSESISGMQGVGVSQDRSENKSKIKEKAALR